MSDATFTSTEAIKRAIERRVLLLCAGCGHVSVYLAATLDAN